MSLYYIFVSGKPLNGLPRWLSSKESTCQSQRCWRYRFNPRKIPWRREQQLTPASILASIIPRPEEHGGLQVMGCKELEMTEQAHDLFENISFCLFDQVRELVWKIYISCGIQLQKIFLFVLLYKLTESFSQSYHYKIIKM